MQENFENIRSQVDVENIAIHLMGRPERGMYRFPGERTPSIKIYKETGSFFDFGRAKGGDVIALWAHVRNCNNWEAMNEIAALYGISTALNETDKENIDAKIKRQEKAQKEREQAEKRKRKQWIAQVDRLHEELELYDNLLNSQHIPPLSWVWTWCMNGKQLAEYELDYLCGILD